MINHLTFFILVFSIGIGVLVALLLVFYIIWPKIENYLLKINLLQERKELSKDKLQFRFAAYERLLLFVHRISPQQVMLRNHNESLSISEFKQMLIADIENEFQHNYTQQLYVSDAAWYIVKEVKDVTISLIRNTSASLSVDSRIDDFVATILQKLKEMEKNPYDAAQIILKNELSA